MAALPHEIEGIEPGGHLCLIYEDDPCEQLPALVPFLRQGLANGERCIYVADDQTIEQVAHALREAGIDADAEIASGALVLWTREQWRQPGPLSSIAKKAQVQEAIESALRAGFRGIRFAVEMTWTLDPDINPHLLRHWEATINEIFTPDQEARIICQYSRRRLSPATIRAGLATHPYAVLGTKVVPNPYYEAPLILQEATEADEIEWMISTLRRARARATELAAPGGNGNGADEDLGSLLGEAEQIAERLRESEEELRDLFENGIVALHWADEEGTILKVNRAELEMLGYHEHEYVGRNLADFYVDPAAIAEVFHRLKSGERVQNYEAGVRCKDGSVRHVLIDSSVLWRRGNFVHTRTFTRDITERKAADELAARLAAIVESSDDAIVSKDLQGTIKSWNAAAERLFGYTAQEAIGRSIRMLIPADRQGEEDEVLAAVRRGERVDHYETVRQGKDGTQIDISLTLSPVRDASGRVIGASKIARDISLRKRAEEALAQSAKLKDEFLGLVSHELRTPIAIVVGNGDILLRHGESLTEEQRQEALKDLVTHAERLQGIIENLLFLSRVEVSEQVAAEPVQLERLAVLAVESFQRRDDSRQITVSSEGATPLVMGEPALLTVVLENLLSNAHKYSPQGAPIEIRLVNEGRGRVELHVLDRGLGLDPDEREAVFGAFYRSNAAKTRAGGMGLGLAVCERVMVAQGGSIRAEAREDGGSDFVINLPALEDESFALAARQAE
jgi:hypothetical protein